MRERIERVKEKKKRSARSDWNILERILEGEEVDRREEKIDEEEKGDGFRGGKIWGDKKIALKSGCNFCLEFSDD